MSWWLCVTLLFTRIFIRELQVFPLIGAFVYECFSPSCAGYCHLASNNPLQPVSPLLHLTNLTLKNRCNPLESCLLTSLPVVFNYLPFISFVSANLKTSECSALFMWIANRITLSHLGILLPWSSFLLNTCPKMLSYLSPLNFQINHSKIGFWSYHLIHEVFDAHYATSLRMCLTPYPS